jgi:hypothetical protein
MRSCKRLKNINSVSGKLGERQVDPMRTVTIARFRKFRLRINRANSLSCLVGIEFVVGRVGMLPLHFA